MVALRYEDRIAGCRLAIARVFVLSLTLSLMDCGLRLQAVNPVGMTCR